MDDKLYVLRDTVAYRLSELASDVSNTWILDEFDDEPGRAAQNLTKIEILSNLERMLDEIEIAMENL